MRISYFDGKVFLLGECKKNAKTIYECKHFGQCLLCNHWKSHNKTVEKEDDIPKSYK